MIKLSIRILIICILINANILAKNNEYYYLDNRECSIAIPLDFYILGGFTESRIAFLQKKGLEINTITIIKENQRKRVDFLKEAEQKEHNALIEEKKIGHLLYLKFKVPIIENIFEYRHNIFGDNFFWGSNNVKQKDIDYMIKHCVETYKGSESNQ